MMEEKEKEEDTTSSNNEEEEREIGEEKEEAWGTLEELLLACAVNRHGTNSWDSIANELKKRIKHSSKNSDNNGGGDRDEDEDDVKEGGEISGSGFSSYKCRKKYVHLKRRFPYDKESDEEQQHQQDEGDEHLQRMVDELRKLRVEELKREVHRRDVSIVSLELKVKKLEEERETKSKVKEEVLISDLRNQPEINATKTGDKPVEPERSSAADKAVAAADSAENRSCNESNSTNHHENNNNKKIDSNNKNDLNNIIMKSEPEESGLIGPENGNKKRNEPVVLAAEKKVSRLASESTQQSSEVQSCASLSKKKRRRFRGVGGDSGDELEAEEVSPANKRINAKSQPLVRFLEILRSHKHGSVFQRRLPSQETEKYRNVIRQHMDLDTVQSRLDKGIYCDCHPKFYRDLLLIFTNAVLFYRKSSAEHIAARELRKLVIDEVTQKTRKPKVQQRKPDPEPQPLEPVVKKPRSSTTMVVCRRRSSSSMQALSDSIKKGDTSNVTTISKNDVSEKVENGRDEKIKPSHHQKKVVNGNDNGNSNKNSSNNNSESPSIKKEKGSGGGVSDGNLKKLLTRERSNLGNGGLRLSSNNGKKIISKDGSKREKLGKVSKDGKDESSDGEGAGVLEKKKINNTDLKQEKGGPIVLKKQGVADFLKRMKQNSPSSQEKAKNNGSEEEENENEEKGGRKEKISSANNNNVKKTSGNLKKNVKEVEAEVGTTRRSSGRRVETEAAASRRGIGRPPKRKAAMMSSNTNTPDSAKGGRSVIKDGGETLKKKPRR